MIIRFLKKKSTISGNQIDVEIHIVLPIVPVQF